MAFSLLSNRYGDCRSDKMGWSLLSAEAENADTLLLSEDDLGIATFQTGENFGCVHFEKVSG